MDRGETSSKSHRLDFVCDWYDAAIPDQCPVGMAQALSSLLEGSVREVNPPGGRGYQRALQIFDTTEGVHNSRALIMFEHPQSPDRVLVSANGPAGEAARLFYKAEGIEHVVNRYDSAVDMQMSDYAFRRRAIKLKQFCHGLPKAKPCLPIGDFDGAYTLNMNFRDKKATDSPHKRLPEAQCVFYEKGKQLDLDPAWKRLEMRLRPQKPDAKEAAAKLEPRDVWGAFEWTGEVLKIGTASAASVSGVEYPRFRMSLPEVEAAMQEIRAMSALKHMMQQYRGQIDVLVEKHGKDYVQGLLWGLYEGSVDVCDDPQELYRALYEDHGKARVIN